MANQGKRAVNIRAALLASAAFAAIAMASPSVAQQAIEWDAANAGTTNWADGPNWSGGTAPTAASNVIVNNLTGQVNPQVSSGAAAGTLQIGSAGSGGVVVVTAGGTLDVTNDLTVGAGGGGTLQINQGGITNVTGDLDVGTLAGSTGSVMLNNGNSLLTVGGLTEIGTGGSGTMTITGTASFASSDDVNVGQSGSVRLNGGSFTADSVDVAAGGSIVLGTTNATGSSAIAAANLSAQTLNLDGLLQINQFAEDAGGAPSFYTDLNGVLSGTGEIFLARGGLIISGDASDYEGVINLSATDALNNTNANSSYLVVASDMHANAIINGGVASTTGPLVKNYLTLDGDIDVASQITGSWRQFTKVGEETTVLSGNNTFLLTGIANNAAGSIAIEGGALQVSSDANLGDSRNAVSIANGTLSTTASFTSGRLIQLQTANSAINVAGGTELALTGALGGAGRLNIIGGGTLDIRDVTAGYNGGVAVSDGTLIGNVDTIIGAVENAGTVVFDQAVTQNFNGTTSGSGIFVKEGSATLGLTQGHTSDWIVNDGILAAKAGMFTGDVEIADDAAFRFDTQTDAAYAGSITGSGTFNKTLGGTLTLTGDNSTFSGNTGISSGILLVNGSLGGDVAVGNLSGLGGSGAVGGNVVIAGNGALIGQQGETLSIGGNVDLSATSNVNVTLGAPEAGFNPALFDVAGDLTLDGTINVADAADTRGNFRAGVYRIFDYGGTLTNNGLEIGGVPTGSNAADLDVQTAIGGQVNLVNSGGQSIRFWDGGLDGSKNDGEIQGGDGIWRNGDANWANTDGSANAGWDSSIAIFGGAAGTVTIDGSVASGGTVSAGGMQFITDGYTITGDNLTLTGIDGVAAIGTDAGVTATIDTVLEGTAQIDKWGGGTLVIESDSLGYGGSTMVSEGTLLVNGGLGGDVAVEGALGGTGTIGGNVTVADGGALLGRQGETLTMGDLNLSAGSDINVELGAPGNDTGLFNVNGDLVLDGTINVADAGGFGRGVYRVIDYSGNLTDNGLDIGLYPGSWDLSVQTAIDNQVNLVVGSNVQFWNGSHTNADGTIRGGDGVWRNDPRTNWTDENAQDEHSWQQNIFAVFQGQAGTVTVDDSTGQVSVGGMQFGVDGYTVVGDSIALNADDGQTVIRVGDGTAAGAEYSAVISSELTGTTGLEKTDLGTLVLTGENTYSGGTTITNGAIVLGNGGTSGSITGDVAIADDAGLIFNRSDEYIFGGVIGGTGIVGQVGTGTTILTADSSAFGGTTEVVNGGLQVSGSLGGVINVRNGALLDGTGSVGDVIVHSGGTIGAGTSGSIGDFNVGDLTFNGGSSYLVNVAADGTGDRLFSSGEVVINGGVVDARAGTGNYADQTRYTIITAEDGVTRGGPNDGFDGVTSNLAFLTPTLEYDADNVYLVMDRNDFSFCLPGSTRNQCATGEGAESTGPGNPIYDTILNLTDPEARDAFDQLSGEIHASAMTGLIADSRFVREATGDRIRGAFGGVGKPQQVITYEPGIDLKDPTPRAVVVDAEQVDGLALWTHGFGSWGEFDGDGNAANMERDIGGIFAGADIPVFDNMRLGVVGGYSHSSFSVGARNSSSSSDNYDLGIYGGGQWDQLGVRFGANYTWHDLSTDRSVAYRGFSDSLSADYDARTIQVYGDVGYTIDVGGTKFEPFAGLAYVNLKTDGFTESGGAAALTGFGNDMETTFSTIGVRASHDFNVGEFQLTASGMVGWRHAFGDQTPTSTHQFDGGSPFTISGVPLAQDVAVFEAGLNTAINDTLTVGVSYSGQVGDGISDHGLRGNLSWKF